jgi:hypothetical protein
LGTLIQTLITNGSDIEEILYCAESNALNDQRIPITNLSDPRIPKLEGSSIPLATLAIVKAANYLLIPVSFSARGGPVTEFATRRFIHLSTNLV